MSIGLTVAEPRATAGNGFSPGAFLGTPRALAILTTFCGPSSIEVVRSTYAVFTEFSVAVIRLIAEP